MIKLESIKEDIRKAALDARINLAPAEEASLENQLKDLLKQAAFLREMELDMTEPTFFPHDQQNTLREDNILPSMPLVKALENAPEADDTFFLVPKIIE